MNNEPDYQDNLFFDNRIPKETKKLKELLKESKIYVENFIESSTLINEHHVSYILLQRIKEVLDEEAS